MPTIVLVSSLLDFLLVFLFQRPLHPWRRILAKVWEYLALNQEIFGKVANQQLIVQEKNEMGETGDATEMETLRGRQSSVEEVSWFSISSFDILCLEGCCRRDRQPPCSWCNGVSRCYKFFFPWQRSVLKLVFVGAEQHPNKVGKRGRVCPISCILWKSRTTNSTTCR